MRGGAFFGGAASLGVATSVAIGASLAGGASAVALDWSSEAGGSEDFDAPRGCTMVGGRDVDVEDDADVEVVVMVKVEVETKVDACDWEEVIF